MLGFVLLGGGGLYLVGLWFALAGLGCGNAFEGLRVGWVWFLDVGWYNIGDYVWVLWWLALNAAWALGFELLCWSGGCVASGCCGWVALRVWMALGG